MIEKIKRKKGFSYRARVTLPDNPRYSKTFKRRIDAEKWERQVLYQIQTGSLHQNKHETSMTFSELVRYWFINKVKTTNSPRSINNYKSDVRVHLLGWLASTPISEIKRSHAEELIKHMQEKGYSKRTINKILGRLKQILNYAVDSELLVANPLNRFSELKEPPASEFYLTNKEVEQLLVKNNQEWIYPLLLMALNTGMRLGELAGLCWDRVNFERSLIEVNRTLTREGLQQTTKSHKKRYVPMNNEVKLFLQNERRLQKHPEFVLLNKKQQPIDVNHISQRDFKESAKRAGLEKVKFHGLRHTFASHFMMNGGNIYDLQKILGHSDLTTTMKYAHLSPDHLKSAINIVSFTGNDRGYPQITHETNSGKINLKILRT